MLWQFTKITSQRELTRSAPAEIAHLERGRPVRTLAESAKTIDPCGALITDWRVWAQASPPRG